MAEPCQHCGEFVGHKSTCQKLVLDAAVRRGLEESISRAAVLGKVSALKYIDGWIDSKKCMPLTPAASAILDDMRTHIQAALSRLNRGAIMESTTPLASATVTVSVADLIQAIAIAQEDGLIGCAQGNCTSNNMCSACRLRDLACK